MNAFTTQTFTMHQMINIKQVIAITDISRSTIYEMMNVKSKAYDPTFPRAVKLTELRICWSAWEINQWIVSKLASRESKGV